MKTQEIKSELLKGNNFEMKGWYSLVKPSENLFWIVINEKNHFYKNIDSVAKRICQLLKRGC